MEVIDPLAKTDIEKPKPKTAGTPRTREVMKTEGGWGGGWYIFVGG